MLFGRLLATVALATTAFAAPQFTPAQNETSSGLARKGLGDLFDNICWGVEIRREWRSFSRSEKKAYLDAVKCLAKKPHDPALTAQYPRSNMVPINTKGSFYDDMTFIHMDQTDHIHYTGHFLPWHRWYVNMHVKALKEKCGYKGAQPYWDWSLDAHNIPASPIFSTDPETGFGPATGDPNDDYYVKTGALSTFKVNYPMTRNIRRNFTEYPYLDWFWVPRPKESATKNIGYATVLDAIMGHTGDFIGFQNATEKAQSFHPNVHMMMGGDLAGTCPKAAQNCTGGSTWTPNDPLFFLHHANFDRIWYLWQLRHPSNFLAFAGGSIQTYTDPAFPNGYPPWMSREEYLPTDGMFTESTYGGPWKVEDVLNPLTKKGGCYIYL